MKQPGLSLITNTMFVSFSSSVDDRYKTLCNIARSRSVIALGLACFCQQQKEVPQDKTFQVRTFNLVLLCEDEYMVEAQSLRFLVNYGFDFNKQYASGIPYKKGNIEVNKNLFTSCAVN